MKICVTSDTHGFLPKIPECDIFMHAGDICPVINHRITYQKHFIHNDLLSWFNKKIPSKHNVFTPGNHDYIFEKHPEFIPTMWKAHCLIDQFVEIEGLKIWGSPWQTWFRDWAFNAPKEGGEEFLDKIYSKIPDDTDIIITHGPPYGLGDKTDRGDHTGSHSLLKAMERIKPKFVITGHIHSAVGSYRFGDTTQVINASYLNERYLPHTQPIMLEI